MTDNQVTNAKDIYELINNLASVHMMHGDRRMTYIINKHVDPVVRAHVIDKLSLRFKIDEKKSWRGNTKLIITF